MIRYSLENRLEDRRNLRNNRQSQPILPIGPVLFLFDFAQRHDGGGLMRSVVVGRKKFIRIAMRAKGPRGGRVAVKFARGQ